MQSPYYQEGHTSRSQLATLRALIPERPMNFGEALRLAELQAARLLELTGVDEAPISEEVVLSQPRIKLRYHQLRAASGMTYWNGSDWIIGVNSTEPLTRQRFTMLHEYKHIIDHGRTTQLYRGAHQAKSKQAEQAADYFAGCVLVPKRLLKQAWYRGVQSVPDLAKLFDVSTAAIEVRLRQVGLVNDLATEQRPDTSAYRIPQRPATWYFRSSSYASTTLEAAPCPN